MIQIAGLFKHIIPLETLFKLPKSFVHRLRDIKIEELKKQAAEAEMKASASPKPTNPLLNGAAIEDLLDELS